MSVYNTLDKMKLEYTVPSVGNYRRIDPTEIYLARPGKRTIGKLNGVDEDSCHLEINLQNTSVLEFTVNRIVDGDISNFYEFINQHYEIYAKGFGWFKINEEPQIDNDGNVETKQVRAESLEIELQQFDLVDFEINTGQSWSKEMLALDNTYEIVDGYKVPRMNVKFWIDVSQWDELIENFPNDGTVEDLLAMLPTHTFLYDSWRISFDLDNFDQAIREVATAYEQAGETAKATEIRTYIGNVEDQYTAFRITQQYPEILSNVNAVDVDLTYIDNHQEERTGTVKHILRRERQRLKDLSFLDLVLKETGWQVGYVDITYNPNSEDESERERLADRVGYFQVDTQDVYSFLTQEASQYYRCVLDFNSEVSDDNVMGTVNAYKVESLGKDTNIFLNFHNIQNSVTRTSDKRFYTVYHVANGSGDDNIDIKEANFGTDEIEDISYFLNRKHFDQTLIDKYNEWFEERENRRQDYMDLSVQYRDALDTANEIKSRVPVDSANSTQYSSFTVEELEAERANCEAQVRGLQAMHVDDNGDFDLEELKASRDWPTYQILTEVALSDPSKVVGDEEDALMIMDYDSGIRKKIDDAYKIKREIENLVSEEEQIRTNIAAETDQDKLDQLAEQLLQNIAAQENKSSELQTLETAISNYYENNKYDGIIDDDTISTVMMYCLSDNRLGQIDTELFNRWIVKSTSIGDPIEKLEFDEDYLYDFSVYGDAYGLDELEAQLKSLENKVDAEKQYSGKEDQSDEYHRKHVALYNKYLNAYESCKTVYEQRKQEYDDALATITRIENQMSDLRDLVKKENFIDSNDMTFTEKELWLLQRYYIHTDYVNDNIVITDLFTNEQIVKTEYDLYKDALEQLYADSHPQWSFQTTQDNLLMMPELEGWHGDLEIGNFIRVGFREDDPYYIHSGDEDNQVKLRLISIGLNPFMIEPTIDLTFSNMVQYKSKRNDFVEIIGSASGGSGKNQVSANYRGDSGTTVNITPDFIMKLLNSDAFSKGVGGLISGSPGFANAVGGVVSDALNDMDISVDQVSDLKTRLTDLVNGYVDANVIATKVLYAESGIFDEITTDNAFVNGILTVGTDSITTIAEGAISTAEISADQITSGTIDTGRLNVSDIITVGASGITTIAENAITTENVIASLVDADVGDFDELTASSAFVQYLNSGIIEAGTVSADAVIAALVDADVGDFDELTAQSGFIQKLNSGLIEAGTITAEQIITGIADVDNPQDFNLLAGSAFIDYLENNMIVSSEIKVGELMARLAEIDVADIEELYADNAFVNSLQALSSTAATSVITQAYVYDMVAGHISVADLDTHNATADQIVLISSEGDPAIAFKNATQQFYDEDGNVRVQIGQDGNGDFNFIVRGADGTTALFDEHGITQSGVPNNTIINNMIVDGTIQKGKLGFQIIEPNEQGGIDITQVYDGSGNNFGVSYTQFTQNTSQALDDLNGDIDEINSKKMYRVVVESDNGNIFKNGDINCTLSCKVYSWDEDITDDINAVNFTWTRKSKDTTGDTQWNTNHSSGQKSITITPSDVYGRSVFYCTVTLPDGTSATGG